MGSQVPEFTVSFGVSFGRSLLTHPDYSSVGLFCRLAWFEAHLIATERDGLFSARVVELRLDQAWDLDEDILAIKPAVQGQTIGLDYDAIWAALEEQGMIEADERQGWYRLVGWTKYQSRPERHDGEVTPAAIRKRRQREREKAGVTPSRDSHAMSRPVTPLSRHVTHRARTSVSSSSSVSKRPPRPPRGGNGSNERDKTGPEPVGDVVKSFSEKLGIQKKDIGNAKTQ